MNDLEPVIVACQYILHNFPGAFQAKKYVDGRISEAAQNKFGFGYFPEEYCFEVLLSIVSDQVLVDLKLRYDRYTNNGTFQKIKTSTFENHNLIMPYRDVYGRPVALVGRSLLSEADQIKFEISKYKNTSFEKKNHVFGLFEGKRAIMRHDCVFVVEGQFDCIKAHDRGIENVVAIGSSNMSLFQLSLMKRYTNNIYMLLDNDEAGRTGAEKALSKYSNYASLHSKFVPAGYKDLDDYLNDNENISYQDLIRL